MKQVIFDCETTSADASTAKIVQLALHVTKNNKILSSKSKLYNPETPISESASEVTGITDSMVKNAPLFAEDAHALKKIFENSILVGYNILRFDIPVLINEFENADIQLDLSTCKIIDVMILEQNLNPRTLSAVYERYTDKLLENAHDALSDVIATDVILKHQLNKIEKSNLDKDVLLTSAGLPENAADFFGKFKYDDDRNLIYNFGKWNGYKLLHNKDTKQYADWILTQNFPSSVKKIIRNELKKEFANKFKKPAGKIHPNPNNLLLIDKPLSPIVNNNNDDLPF